MHHLSWIRIDIKNKINSWSSKKYFNSKLPDIIYNRYVNWKEGECAIIMFSVPRNRINVVTFRNQYIHPKYRIDYKLDENRDKYNGGK